MGAPTTRSPSPGLQRRPAAGSTTALSTPSSAAMKELRAEQQLTVALRIRPINEDELEEGAAIIAHRVGDQMVVLMDPTEDPDDILRANRSREKTFIFDMVFGHKATQEEVYMSTTKNLIEGIISGYNATVFAYGAGKTYTMLGTDSEPGIYIRTLNDLFRAIEATSGDMNYSVCMSYLEIYNEVIRDLLNPSSGCLELREDSKGSIQIAGITEVSTTNAQEIMQLLTRGNKERTQEPTAANKTSSRSHAVLQVTVKQTSRVKDINEEVRVGRLFMVDLAGSERAAQAAALLREHMAHETSAWLQGYLMTQNRGKRMKEGAHINRSLLALGNCINALSEKGGSRAQYVNFRDSKLTRLLKVKRNLLNVSYHIAQYTSIISDLRREIERLKAKIENQEKERRGTSDVQGRAEAHQDAEESSHQEMNKLRKQLVGAFKEQMDMRRSLMELENTNMELHVDASRHLVMIADWEQEKAHQACRFPNKPLATKKDDEAPEEADREDSPEPHEVAVAREEIQMLLAEQRKTAALKAELEQRLAIAKKKASQMEKLLPQQLTNEDQREVLRLLCKAHELEVGNTELQASALCKENLLGQKDFVIQRHQQYRRLCEEIIQQQWSLIRDHNIPVPGLLGKLHRLYSREFEEGTLDRLLLLHSLISSALRDVPEKIQLLDLNKEENRKGSFDLKRDQFGGPRFELPPIVVDSDRSCKNTPARRKLSCEWTPSPTSFSLLKTPVHQAASGIPRRKASSKLCSPRTRSRASSWKTPGADVSGGPLSREEWKEIADSTKRIALIAASRRSRAQDGGPGSELASVYYLDDETLEVKRLQPSLTPEHSSKDPESADSQAGEPPRPRRKRKKERRKEKPLEGETGVARSRSLELASPRAFQVDPSGHADHVLESQLPKDWSPEVIADNPTSVFPAVTKIKLPVVGQQTEEKPLQDLAERIPAQSTVPQSVLGSSRGQVLPKQIKGQGESTSGRQKQQPQNAGTRNTQKSK
ncbi:hypothetical protein lerEdw1_004509 [Lerista edwardsae]|nr:hypothetical protein lerEdw1_004509 [Lerista edwardsae]